MELTSVIALLLIAAFLSVLLRKYHPEFSLAVALVSGVVVMGAVVSKVAPAFSAMQSMLDKTAIPSTYIQVLFKGLGVCFLTQTAADTCKDAGETALAAKAELVGKVMLLVLTLPLFQEVTELALSWMQG